MRYTRRLTRLERSTNDTDATARYVSFQIEGLPMREPPLLCVPYDYAAVIAELLEGEPNEPYAAP